MRSLNLFAPVRGATMALIMVLALATCRLPGWAQEATNACSASKRINLGTKKGTVPIAQISGAVLFEAGLAIDADGAPNAYGPHNKGLDLTVNARGRNGWAGLVADKHGRPVLQKRGPYRGYYVSTTSLEDASIKRDANLGKYVDARKIPYIVLPVEVTRRFDIHLGDFAVVFNQSNGRFAYAIYADVGPHGKLGEGSMALAQDLGLPSNPRGGGVEDGVSFLVFPGSGRVRESSGRLRKSTARQPSCIRFGAAVSGSGPARSCRNRRRTAPTLRVGASLLSPDVMRSHRT